MSGLSCVPRWFTVVYTVLVVTLVPVFALRYGLSNFLWLSNIALLGTIAAIWLRSRLLLGMMAVGVILPELGWNLLFWGGLLLGWDLLGLVGYMFDERIPLWARLLSLYHVPLPFVLIWLVRRCGYDPRALRWQTALAWVVLPLSFLVGGPQENLNLTHGLPDAHGEPVPSPPFGLLLLMAGLPLLVYWPTHLLLKRLATRE
jgi:hypothetical protein